MRATVIHHLEIYFLFISGMIAMPACVCARHDFSKNNVAKDCTQVQTRKAIWRDRTMIA